MSTDSVETIDPNQVETLAALLRERVKLTPDLEAYRQYDESADDWDSWTWSRFAQEAARWQIALQREDLEIGDRVGIMAPNSREWEAFDVAAQGLGLVTVPLYVNDRPDNLALVVEDAGVKLLVVGGEDQWTTLAPAEESLAGLQRIVSLEKVEPMAGGLETMPLHDWLPAEAERELHVEPVGTDTLATIVYTSGTTGRPKGVMLSHRNILWNVEGCLTMLEASPNDIFLSFLPLSHMLERTCGFYLPMAAGSTIAFARSPKTLAEDFDRIQPTIVIAVPRVFERVYAKIQELLDEQPGFVRSILEEAANTGWDHFLYQQGRGEWKKEFTLFEALDKIVGPLIRKELGGKMRVAFVGGAAMPDEIAKAYIGLGIPILQGYGATETSPVLSVNIFEDNIPNSVGIPIPNAEVRIGENDELLTRSPSVMLGYWNRPEATRKAIDSDGWFHTGDQAKIEDNHIFITGRIKEIIVMANGEKVPPGDMENAIGTDALVDQVMVFGDNRPFLAAFVLLNRNEYQKLAAAEGLSAELEDERLGETLEKIVVGRIAERLKEFPGYAKIRRVAVMEKPWKIEDGLMTPTLKLKRAKILETFQADADRLYQGH